jgi:hypothetical protein
VWLVVDIVDWSGDLKGTLAVVKGSGWGADTIPKGQARPPVGMLFSKDSP